MSDVEEKVKQSFLLLRTSPVNSTVDNKTADTYLVTYAIRAMQEKLDVCRGKGRGGWWDKDKCKIEHLKELLVDHIMKGDMIDVMNIAAMIYIREIADN